MIRLSLAGRWLPALFVSACALDGVGKRDPGEVAGATSSTGVSGATTSTTSGPSSTTTGGQGGDGAGSTTSAGGAGQGGEATGGAGQGGAGQGGEAVGPGGSGAGGTSGVGGAGGASSTGVGGGGGAGGAGGQGPACGDGNVDAGEECDSAAAECDLATCMLRGDCDVDRPVAFAPGGLFVDANTNDDPKTVSYGTCADTGGAPTHLYTYTTGPSAAYVQVVVNDDASGLRDPVLSFHGSCFDEAISSCLDGASAVACCSDEVALQDEALLTPLLAGGTTFTVAVSGYQGSAGHYGITFRDYRYLFVETFEPPPGQFTASGSANGWAPRSGVRCADDSACMGLADDGQNHDAEALTSSAFAATGIGAAVLGWHHAIDDAFLAANDSYRVQLSTDDGATWATVYTHPQAVDEVADKQVDVSFVAGEPSVRIRFLVEDNGGDVNAWYVDDVYVLAW